MGLGLRFHEHRQIVASLGEFALNHIAMLTLTVRLLESCAMVLGSEFYSKIHCWTVVMNLPLTLVPESSARYTSWRSSPIGLEAE